MQRTTKKRKDNGAVPRDSLLDPDIGAAAIERRLGRIEGARIKPLTEWVRRIRKDRRLPPGAGATIPWFDPCSGGVHARVLLLLQDPSETATKTGFISPDNNDPTARCTTVACNTGNLSRADRLHWNVYPWWVGGLFWPRLSWPEAGKIAAGLWVGLFQLLPRLEAIIVFGSQSKKGWDFAVAQGLAVPDNVKVHFTESLTPPPYYRHRREIDAKIAEVARSLGPPTKPPN